jgi:hypothetical protein
MLNVNDIIFQDSNPDSLQHIVLGIQGSLSSRGLGMELPINANSHSFIPILQRRNIVLFSEPTFIFSE